MGLEKPCCHVEKSLENGGDQMVPKISRLGKDQKSMGIECIWIKHQIIERRSPFFTLKNSMKTLHLDKYHFFIVFLENI